LQGGELGGSRDARKVIANAPSMNAQAGIPIIYRRILFAEVGGSGRSQPGAIQSAVAPSAGVMSEGEYAQVLRQAAALSGDPLIALRAGARMPFSVHGPLGIAAMSSASLGDALDLIARYAVVRNPFCRIELEKEGQRARMSFAIDPAMGNQAEQALDLIVATVGRSVSDSVAAPLRPCWLDLTRKQPESAVAERYSAILGCPVRYGQSQNAFIFDSRDLGVGMRGANPEEFDGAMERLRAIHAMLSGQESSLAEAVVSVFASQTGHLCSLSETAQALRLSTRTLQRGLKREGERFQDLRERWLGEQACHLLLREKLPVEVVSSLLGYRESVNFRRLFHRLYGESPGRFRQIRGSA